MLDVADLGFHQRQIFLLNGMWERVNPGTQPEAAWRGKMEPQVSVMVDLANSYWLARKNWVTIRDSFLLGVTGKAEKTRDGSIEIHCGWPSPVRLGTVFLNGSPKNDGMANRGSQRGRNGGTFAEFTTHWWRYCDPSIMGPLDVAAEMFDRAIRGERLKVRLREEFGQLAHPAVLMPIGAIMVAMFGAEVVGGAAFVIFIARVLGISQILCDYHFYEPHLRQLQYLIFNCKTVDQIDDGAKHFEAIFVQIIADIATTLGIGALVTVASRLFRALAQLSPKKAEEMLNELKPMAVHSVLSQGYARRELLQKPSTHNLEADAVRMFKESSKNNVEVIAVRDPGAGRLKWVNSPVPVNGKPTWLKAKTSKGVQNLVCLPKSGVSTTASPLKPAGTYDLSRLRGATEEMDRIIDIAESKGIKPQKYEMPTDGRAMEGIDYGKTPTDPVGYTGKNNEKLKGKFLVDLGEKYLVVDERLSPYVGDADIATRQRPGTSHAGSHLPDTGPKRHPEDDAVLEWELNQSYHRKGTANPGQDPVQHGGGGASTVHVRVAKLNGGKHWSPRNKDGSFQREDIYIFLPEMNGHGMVVSNMYIVKSWDELQQFCNANRLEFPF